MERECLGALSLSWRLIFLHFNVSINIHNFLDPSSRIADSGSACFLLLLIPLRYARFVSITKGNEESEIEKEEDFVGSNCFE